MHNYEPAPPPLPSLVNGLKTKACNTRTPPPPLLRTLHLQISCELGDPYEVPEQTPIVWYLALRAADAFKTKNGRYPGEEDDQVGWIMGVPWVRGGFRVRSMARRITPPAPRPARSSHR